jgi:predicted outer membrane repeat protein
VIINDNTAYSNGGGIFNNWDSSAPVLTNVTICRNTASGDGGGMYATALFGVMERR